MAVIHISDTDAARDFLGLLAQVRAGAEVVIESDSKTIAFLRPADFPKRTISESIELLRAHSKELGFTPTMDPDFAADLETIIDHRKPGKRSAWD